MYLTSLFCIPHYLHFCETVFNLQRLICFQQLLTADGENNHTSTRTRSFVNHVRKTRSATRRYTNHFLILQDSLNAVLLAINPGVLSFPLHCLRYQSASQNQTQAGNWTNYSADGKKTKNIQLCKSEVKAAPAIRPHQNDFSSPHARSRLPSIQACW